MLQHCPRLIFASQIDRIGLNCGLGLRASQRSRRASNSSSMAARWDAAAWAAGHRAGRWPGLPGRLASSFLLPPRGARSGGQRFKLLPSFHDSLSARGFGVRPAWLRAWPRSGLRPGPGGPGIRPVASRRSYFARRRRLRRRWLDADVVGKRPVVAHEETSAVVVLEKLFEKFRGFDIEVSSSALSSTRTLAGRAAAGPAGGGCVRRRTAT